jgi:rubrerythrin
MALDVEQACLGFLEEQFRDAREQENRTFLQRAIEEERGHFVLLSDMRYYYEQAGGSAG